jgi:hypothetical protein
MLVQPFMIRLANATAPGDGGLSGGGLSGRPASPGGRLARQLA